MKKVFALLFTVIIFFGFSQSKILTGRGEQKILTSKNDSKKSRTADDTIKTTNIETVILRDQSDPQALEILRNVEKNYTYNSPKSLPSYAFRSYEKISLDLDQDSISDYRNAFNEFGIFRRNPKKDSMNEVSARKIFAHSKLFLWERAQEFLYSEKYGEKINILDNRISGLKQPVYELIALQGNREKIPDQIKQENRGLYRFYLTDTIEIGGRQNFVIRFREISYNKNAKKRKFSGYIYVDTETYGIKKIENTSREKSEANISSTWIFFENKWFLQEENVKIRMSRMVLEKSSDSPEKRLSDRKNFGTYAYLTSRYFDFQSPVDRDRSQFGGYTFTVKNANGHTLNQYRTEPLTLRERNTYKTIDSLGKKFNIDRKARILTALFNGQLRAGSIDFDIGEVVNYNMYEGFRVGLKAKLNENFDRYFSPDYYIAFGTKDQTYKYGIGLDMKTRLDKNEFFRLEYYDDVNASGEFYRRLWTFKMRMMNYGNNLNNDNYYGFRGVSLSYLNDITNGLTLVVAASRNREDAKFNYSFRNVGSEFENFNTLVTLKYSPKSTNIMTPQGKSVVEQRYPELYFNYEQSFRLFGGDFNYTRFDALFVQNFKTFIGNTGVRFYGGIVLGNAPIWKHFTTNGLASPSRDLNFNLTSYLGFATLEGGKYYNDRFMAYYVTHKIPFYFKSFGKNISSFDFVLRGTIGDMRHPEYHDFRFQKLDHLYQEVGVEWNNFLSSYFNLGFFYRVGHYTTSTFAENFAVQFKLKLLEF
ncbi:hypothetical protein ASG01_11030 [Chryseobacterium sp. Leaf180]|uniref:hypothetical protein n=1 Tax=Chryseobacterium sp. Leaf180 TaxID=1736289 RepID=UPI0006FB8FBC|nr:hypothetical protein [Chryseobacterium sp. Leaf180]KQR92448.1 hypothetical protein ASG01_11030 [Chryseobacterium sp. Leaf180]